MKRLAIVPAVLCGAVLLVLLCLYDPTTHLFPKCPFYVMTGLMCPGCGSQRAIYQLLHGNLAGAFHYNGFMIASLPYVGALVTVCIAPKTRLVQLRNLCFNPVVVWCYVGVIVAWWVIRNIWLVI